MKKTLIGTIFVLAIFIGIAFAPSGMCEDKAMEKWMQDHTLKVNSTTTYKYEQGYLLIKEVYTGEELKERFGVEQLTKELKIPAESKAVGMQEGEEKVFVTEKVTVLTSEDDPPHWWDEFNYPQWTWFKVLGMYEQEFPITLAWRNVKYKWKVEEVIRDEGWYDVDYTQSSEYVYDREKGWVKGKGMATERLGVLGRDHVLLWEMSDGNVVASTHHDSPLVHVPVSDFEEVEEEVAGFFADYNREWRVYEDSYYLDNICEDIPLIKDCSDVNGWCTQITEGPATWYVDNDGGEDFKKIQKAINVAIEGDTIIVKSGKYDENVVVDKSITLRGEDRDNTIIDGSGNGDVIKVIADGCEISGFTVRNSGTYGTGIHLYYSDNNILTNNNASNNYNGIHLWYSSNNTITNNIANSNKERGIYLYSLSNSTITNNIVNSNNDSGIYLCDSSNSTITNNIVNSNNNSGIYLYSLSNNNTITNNLANLNSDSGIYLRYLCCNNLITNNTVNSNKERGIYLDYSSNNIIYLNNFINNAVNVHSRLSTNIWNSTEKITYPYNRTTYENYLGNYWDDYVFAGNDTNKDGIGDTPYFIDSDKDNYPLMEPWENYFENWPMFRHDARHTGYSNATAPDTNDLLWSFETGDRVYSSPAVADGKVFVGSWDNKIYCLNEETGELIWSYLTAGDVRSSPAVADGRVFVGSYDNKIYCLDEDTGKLIWSYETGGDVFSSPVVGDGKVFVGSGDNKIYCIDENTGRLIWTHKTGGDVDSSPAVANGKVFIGSWDKKIYCLDKNTGELVWSYETTGSVRSSPSVADGKVFVGSMDCYCYEVGTTIICTGGEGGIYCLDENTGKLIWKRRTIMDSGGVDSSPAVANGRVFVGSPWLFMDGIGFNENLIYCIEEDTGNLIWSCQIENEVSSSPAIADGKVFIGSDDDKIYCLDEDTGNLIWSYETGNDVYSSPAVADRKVFLGSDDGKIYCFGKAPPKTIYVDDDFVDNPEEHKWDTIQEGIKDTNDGDAVYVYNGLYVENVVVDKSITLQGEDRDNTIIDGGGNGDVVYITADDCEISGFTVGNGTHGIHLSYSNNNILTNNNVSNNLDYGIYLYNSSNNTIGNNNCSNNQVVGIILYHSSNNNKISNNNISWSKGRDNGIHVVGFGISLEDSSNNKISNNNVSNNEWSISLDSSLNNIICLINFINNSKNANSYDSTNIWNSTEKITYTYNGSTYTSYLGNYWDDYKEKYPDAEEIDGCGIWDLPYSINSDNDTYPLVEHWENYSTSPKISTKRELNGNIISGNTVFTGEHGLHFNTAALPNIQYLMGQENGAEGHIIYIPDPTNFDIPATCVEGVYDIMNTTGGDIGDLTIKHPSIVGDVYIKGTTDSIVGESILVGTDITISASPNFGGLMNASDGSGWSKIKIKLTDPDGGEMEDKIDADAQEINIDKNTTGWDTGAWKVKIVTDQVSCNDVDVSSQEYEFIVHSGPTMPARFSSGFYDDGEDTDGDSLYDYLVIEKEVNVSEAGNYSVSGSLYSPSDDYIDSDSNYTTLSAGLHNVTLKFQGRDIYKTEESGNFAVKMSLYYYSPTLTAKIDSMENKTSYYSYMEFEPPPAEFNDQYGDSGEDTDGDGLYNYLVIDVGVNVTAAGDYKVSGTLYENGTFNYVNHAYNITYLTTGNHMVPLKFKGIKIRQNEYNGTYDLKYLYLYGGTYNQLDYKYYAYTTSYYNYTEFEESIPDAYEPDNNCSLANYISVDGKKQTHDFHVPGDHDWLKFNATKGNSYIIETSGLGDESDTYLYLYDIDGTTEIDHDDDSGVGLASKIAWNCSISGTYYVMARHYSSLAFGPETRYNISVTVKEAIFDTGSPSNPYPSIFGMHNGTIEPNQTITVSKLYTYPCPGTGGHTEYVKIWNETWSIETTWAGYSGGHHTVIIKKQLFDGFWFETHISIYDEDWHNITLSNFTLESGEAYNYTIRTGSYPQIIHESPFNATGGTISCDKFVDANGRVYYDWIPAIRLWRE